MIKLTIDPEFRDLLPRLSAEEYSALEESILVEGCREAIIVWGSTIVDGHHRYEICSAHCLPFQTADFYGGPEFDYLPSMAAKVEAVKRWIINTQMARRNLTDEQRAHYLGILFDSGKDEHGGVERIQSGHPGKDAAASEKPRLNENFPTYKNCTLGEQPQKQGDTAARIAKEHGVSRGTVINAGKFAKGIEAVGKIDPAVREKILSGQARQFVKMGDVQAVGRAPEKAIQIVKAILNQEPLAKPPVEKPRLNENLPSGQFDHSVESTLAAAVPAAGGDISFTKEGRPRAISFYADDFLAGVSAMSYQARGEYITLLCMEQVKGPLTEMEVESVTKDVFVHSKFKLTPDGLYYNERMEKEVVARIAFQAAQRDRINKRWNKNGNDKKDDGEEAGGGYRGNTAVIPVLKDLKDKTSLEKQKDVFQDALSQSNNGGNVLSVGVKGKTVGVTDGAVTGADVVFATIRAISDDFNQLPPEEDFNQAGGDDPAEAEALTMPPKAAKEPRKQRGPHGWVKLTDAEYGRLLDEYGRIEVTKRIAYVDECAKMKGNAQKWKDWNLVIRKAIREKWGEKPYGQAGKPLTGRTEYEFERKARESGKYDNL